MKKGFTLIELLSVIVVLAIISVIAVPTLIGVVNKVKLQSLKDSAYGLIEASNLYYAYYQNSKNIRFDISNNKVVSSDTTNTLKYKGTIKSGVSIIKNSGQTVVCVTDGKNSAYKNYNESKVSIVSGKVCTIPSSTSIVYLDGDRTLDELSNQELTDAINNLSDRVDKLESENKLLKEENDSLKTSVSTMSNYALKSELSQVNTNLNSSITNVSSSVLSNSSSISNLSSQIKNLKGLNNFKAISVQQSVTLGANEATYIRLTLSIPSGYKLLFYNVAANNADQMIATPYYDQNFFGKTGNQIFSVGVYNPNEYAVTHTIVLYGICVKES